jgi:hypothetical protein
MSSSQTAASVCSMSVCSVTSASSSIDLPGLTPCRPARMSTSQTTHHTRHTRLIPIHFQSLKCNETATNTLTGQLVNDALVCEILQQCQVVGGGNTVQEAHTQLQLSSLCLVCARPVETVTLATTVVACRKTCTN